MSDIQHTQMLIGIAALSILLGTAIVSLLNHWLGTWPTLLATAAGLAIAYQPLMGSSLLSRLSTDLEQRTLVGIAVFAVILIVLSFQKTPFWVRLIFSVIGPSLLLYWIFMHYDLRTARMDLLVHRILPVAGVVFAMWLLMEPIAVRTPGTAAPLVFFMLTAALAFLLMISTENQAGVIGVLIPACAAGAALAGIVASLIGKPIAFFRGPVLLWATLIATQFAILWIASDKLPFEYLAWLAAVPVLAWIAEIGPIHRLQRWARELIRFLLIAIPVITTIVAAKKQHDREAAESGDPYSLLMPHPAAPTCPSQMPMPNTINPPTMT